MTLVVAIFMFIVFAILFSYKFSVINVSGRETPEVEKVVDSASLTRRKYFQKLGLTENIWENIMG